MGMIANSLEFLRSAKALPPAPMTIEGALAFLQEHGYELALPPTASAPKSSPKAVRSSKAATFRADAMPPHKIRGKRFDRDILEFTFADGEKVRSYLVRENERKAWFHGSCARAACDKWRYRNITKQLWIGDIDAMPVPRIIAVDGESVAALTLDQWNTETVAYRAPSRNRYSALALANAEA